MKRVNAEIQIGDYRFTYVKKVEIRSSWEELTDTCRITVPRKISFQGKNIVRGESLFKRGDQVRVQIGYDGQLSTRFTGYVSEIHPGINLEFVCQDAMWLLKQETVTRSYETVTLPVLLAEICPIPFQATDVSLGTFRISNANIAQVLTELRRTYGLYSWVREGELYSGLAYWPELAERRVFRFEHNIIKESLEYLRDDDVAIKVKAISMQPDNTKYEIEFGDPDGDQRTLHYYNLGLTELKAAAEREIERLKYEGYRGSFLTFGEPAMRHGDIAVIQDPHYPDREGAYLIRKVTTRLSENGGYKQDIKLDTLVG